MGAGSHALDRWLSSDPGMGQLQESSGTGIVSWTVDLTVAASSAWEPQDLPQSP